MSFATVAIGAGLGIAAGVAKSQLVDAPREARQRKLAAETQRYSPWTGLQAQPIQESSALGDALQFGATGAQMGLGAQNAMAQKDLMAAQANWLNSGGSPAYTAAASTTAAPSLTGFNYGQSPWKLGNYNFGTAKF